jgi:hypothetical protein
MSITDEQRDSRRAYRKVVNTVYHNTTPKQPPMIEATTVRVICSYSVDASTVNSKLRMAVKNDDLITDGTRFCVTDDKARLQRAANTVAKQVPVNQDLLGKINKAKINL